MSDISEPIEGVTVLAPKPSSPVSQATHRLLSDPVLPLLLKLAWPNVLIMLAQASAGLIETWWVAHLGTDALAGMALSFPLVMLMQMMSAGAIGGAISSAIARALGRRERASADKLAAHALLISLAIGIFFSAIMLAFGRPIYRALGGTGGELDAAVTYSNIVFAGNVFLWMLNGFASIIRGTGNMLVPALVICVGAVLLVPLSPLLIFGFGPLPALGIAGGGAALALYNVGGTAALAWYALSDRNLVRPRFADFARLNWPMFREILYVGAAGAINTVLTSVTIVLATALVAGAAGAEAVAGFGTGVRLEYLLVPLVFGLGAPMVALVGTNIGAGQRERALRISFVGGAIAFALTEAIGLAAAFWPDVWLRLFSVEPAMIEAGTSYLRIVGPTYGFFGLGLALYFASQGAGRMLWPLAAGFLRVIIAAGGGWLALRWTGSIDALCVALAVGLVAYGTTLALAVRAGTWFHHSPVDRT
jgi:putative MATE family efflux protein